MNLVPFTLAEKMNATAALLPYGESEFATFGIAAILLLLYMFLHPGLRTKRDEAEMGDDEGESPPEPPVVGPVSHRPPGPAPCCRR